MNKLNLAINGAAGRMGKRLIALGSADHDFQIVAAIEYEKHPDIGRDAGVVEVLKVIGGERAELRGKRRDCGAYSFLVARPRRQFRHCHVV